MCGICGMVDLSGHKRADVQHVHRMAEAIRHRGPDGDGFYVADNVVLGMRRLSIIDIAGSEQPLYNEDRTIALVFNGEIYNYRELRDSLLKLGHVFTTDGDGETLIHLYETYGPEMFRHLRGMYAFALWDSRHERLMVAVDHIGMKPLYLYEQDGLLQFASEIKALQVRGYQVNTAVLDTYLSFGYMIGADTLFEGVRRLPPGHALIITAGQQQLLPYWDFPQYIPPLEHEAVPHTAPEIIVQARALLEQSVRLHLRSDVPLGLFLSGGIDSAAMLGVMSRVVMQPVQTYTIGYATQTTDNELHHARRMAQHFNTDHHERVITADDWWHGLQQYVYAHDEPNANPSAVSLLLLSEETARHVKVVLTGLGGDELFGGYMHHRAMPALMKRQASWGRWLSPLARPLSQLEAHYPTMKRYRIIGALPAYLPQIRQALLPRDEGLLRMHSYDGMVFSDILRKTLYHADLLASSGADGYRQRTYREIIARSWREHPSDTAQALIINTWLTGNALLSQDKTAMAHSLEARVPFFDPHLLQFSADVPPAVRMHSNKYVLREAVRPFVPDFALERPKQPFGTPIMRWFEAELSEPIQAVLRDPAARYRAFFNAQGLQSLLDDHFSGRARHTEVIFRLLVLELWQQAFRI